MFTRLPLELPVFADRDLQRLVDALVADRERLNKSGALSIEGALGSFSSLSQAFNPGSFTLPTEFGSVMAKTLKLSGSQRVVLEGTSRLVIV